MVVRVDEHVPTLAVGVVGHDVEHGHGLQLIVEFVPAFEHGEVVHVRVGLDEPLQRAFAHWAIAQDRRRNEVEPHRVGQLVCSDLPTVEARFEVPKRSFSAQWFVDGLRAARIIGDFHEEGRIAAPRHSTDDFDVTFGEKANRIVVID